MSKRIFQVSILLLLLLLLTACKNNNGDHGAAEYKIYYINSKTSELDNESYIPTGNTKEELTKELLDQLRTEPQNMAFRKALPDNVAIKSYTFSSEDELTINFDSTYGELKGIQEILCRAALVKTLTQIKDIKYIQFYISDQLLKDSNDQVVGLMTRDDFIDSIDVGTDYKVTLYFANSKGDALIAAVTNIYLTGTGTLEENVIKQLINGPTKSGLLNTIPEGTTLLNISTQEGICTIDFNEKFLEKLPNITDEVAIYSVVNSLVEIPGINKVQFLINGSVLETYRESLPFNDKFERNLALIQGS